MELALIPLRGGRGPYLVYVRRAWVIPGWTGSVSNARQVMMLGVRSGQPPSSSPHRRDRARSVAEPGSGQLGVKDPQMMLPDDRSHTTGPRDTDAQLELSAPAIEVARSKPDFRLQRLS
jgi:hypothetical protein